MLETQYARQKYRGDTASQYEEKRKGEKKWASEQKILERIISEFDPGARVLDIPVGTGRLVEFYQKYNIDATGMDVNEDMALQARWKGLDDIRYGDVTYIPLGDNAVDHSFCIRLLNWLSVADVKRALGELQRVTRNTITITLRVAEHPRARPVSLVEECLTDGWSIRDNEWIDDGKPEKTFRMITLEGGDDR